MNYQALIKKKLKDTRNKNIRSDFLPGRLCSGTRGQGACFNLLLQVACRRQSLDAHAKYDYEA